MSSVCYVYIMTNEYNTTLYVGFTHDIARRVYEHKHELLDGFTKSYHLHKLVYVEQFNMAVDGIAYEKRLKKFSRTKKFALINEQNPHWRDLAEDFGLE